MNSTLLMLFYGMYIMFCCMMIYVFIRKNKELLTRIVVSIMSVTLVELIVDIPFIYYSYNSDGWEWQLITAFDMIAIPLYAFLTIELCRPGTLNKTRMFAIAAPFILLPFLLLFTGMNIFYTLNVSFAAIYCIIFVAWSFIEIPKYHRTLKLQFSYDDNINLNWLKQILISTTIISGVWVLNTIIVNIYIESTFIIISMLLWTFNSYFLYRHESVIDELNQGYRVERNDLLESSAIESPKTDLDEIIHSLFVKEKIFLNPRLKLSDVARMAGTNRTYLSRFFNNDKDSTFYEYVNTLRVDYASELLSSTTMSIEDIAEKSGFNSRTSFYRVFLSIKGISPSQYRENQQSN